MKIADDIIAAVCAEHGIAVEQIKQRGMYSKPIANARGDAIRRLRAQHFSTQWIANFLNMSRMGVGRHVYPKVKEAQRIATQRYRDEKKAKRAEARA